MSDTPYQQQPQVDQLQAERENAVAYGNETRVAQIDRQLAVHGVKSKAAEERKAATPVEGKGKAPQGRRSPGKSEA